MQRSSLGRGNIDRASINPISSIVGSIQSAVDHVAGGGEHGLRHIVSKWVSYITAVFQACCLAEPAMLWPCYGLHMPGSLRTIVCTCTCMAGRPAQHAFDLSMALRIRSYFVVWETHECLADVHGLKL